MNKVLTNREKDLMNLLIQGQTFNGISQWLGIDYCLYIKTRKSLLKKMKVQRTTQLIAAILRNGSGFEYL